MLSRTARARITPPFALLRISRKETTESRAQRTTMRTNARGYLSTTNSNLSALLNQQKSLDAAKKTIRDDERTIEIYKIGNATGDNPISLQSSQYSIADQER